MTRRVAALALALFAVPVHGFAAESVSGTAFMRQCLADVSEARIAMLKERAPDFAASLGEEDLMAGARQKAVRACPCFLHVIGVSPMAEGETPEEKVGIVVAYLDALAGETAGAMPPVLGMVARNCGERSSVVPPRWFGR